MALNSKYFKIKLRLFLNIVVMWSYYMILLVIILKNILLNLSIKLIYSFIILALFFYIIIYIYLLLKIDFLYFNIDNLTKLLSYY